MLDAPVLQNVHRRTDNCGIDKVKYEVYSRQRSPPRTSLCYLASIVSLEDSTACVNRHATAYVNRPLQLAG